MATLAEQRQALTDAGAVCAGAASNCIQAAQTLTFPAGSIDPNNPPDQATLGVAGALAGVSAQAAAAAAQLAEARRTLEGLT